MACVHAALQTRAFTKSSLPSSTPDDKLERDIEISKRAMQVSAFFAASSQSLPGQCQARWGERESLFGCVCADWRWHRQFGKLPQSVFEKIEASLNEAGPQRSSSGKSSRYADLPSDSPQGAGVLCLCARTSRTCMHTCVCAQQQMHAHIGRYMYIRQHAHAHISEAKVERQVCLGSALCSLASVVRCRDVTVKSRWAA
jgi:hypothetical protein